MTTIRNGQIVSKDDVTIGEHITHIANLAVFFFTSIFSTQPVRAQIDKFNGSRSRTYGGSTNANNSRYAPAAPRSNINTFGPAAQAGCTGGS